MKKLRNSMIFDAAISSNWAMDESALQLVLEVVAREHQITPEALAAYRAGELDKAERATVRDGVAILDISGPLFKRANLMTTFCGATSYDILRLDLQAALDNASVRAILLNIHSPGGEAAGTGELAQAVYDVRGVKPIVAYAADQAASAAYWIGSAADSFWIGRGAAIGSVGVRAGIQDTTKRDEARGVKNYEFVSSQSPFKKLDLSTKQGVSQIQARVDAMAGVFVETVAAHRGVSVAHVLESFGKGDVLIGQAAVDAGMVDGFGTFESVLASLSRGEEPNKSYTGFNPAASGHSQESETTMEKTPEQLAAEAAAAAAALTATDPVVVVPPVPETAAVPAVDTTAADAVTAERARVKDIFALTLPGYEEAAQKAIETGSSAHAFSAMIVTAEKAKRTERASDVAADTEANAEVSPSTGKESAKGDDAAVNAILGAFKLATGN